jgi:uncharacterized membrane protein YgcG
MGGSEYFSNVQLGLWYGVSKATATRPARTFYYGWCDTTTPAYHAANCLSLTIARIGACLGVGLMVASVVVVTLLGTYVIKLRLEPTMARVAAVFAGTATASLFLCVALWARLLLGLSQKDAPSKAALSIGLSWLLACGGALLAFLSTLNLVLAARRIDKELLELGQHLHAGRAVRRGSKSSLQQGAGSHYLHGHHRHHHDNSGKHVHHHHNSGKAAGGSSSSSGSSPVPMA